MKRRASQVTKAIYSPWGVAILIYGLFVTYVFVLG